MRPSWWSVARGRHTYGMLPEQETAIVREAFLFGCLFGIGSVLYFWGL